MKKNFLPALACAALAWTLSFTQQARACEACGDDDDTPAVPTPSPAPVPRATTATPTRQLGLVVVKGNAQQPTSLPTNIPATVEGISADEIARSINATDAEDALKYLPSLMVRKRYDGDYNHAVLSTRASGTGNSARSLVYADGFLLSNLLGNGATFAPRWGLVSPAQIARVDVLYGPFSAAYSGNSAGAVVDIQTRTPKAFEAHAQASLMVQPFELYGTKADYHGHQASAALGDRVGSWSWWVDLSRLDNESQPLTFITRPISSSAPAANAVQARGNVPGLDKSNVPWQILGAGTQYRTVQDQAKLRLALDISPTLRAALTVGAWKNSSDGSAQSYLKDSTGAAVSTGPVSIDGKGYTLAPSDFAGTHDALRHRMAGASLKQQGQGALDWELAASAYDYGQDLSQATTGVVTDLSGTGWNTASARGLWRAAADHQIEFGLQQERYRWAQHTVGSPLAFVGRTGLQSAYAQDAWAIDPAWKAVLGLRLERWQAWDGSKTAQDGRSLGYADRSEHYASPKAAIGWQAAQDLTLKLSTGRAVRMPTAAELYQGGLSSSGAYVAGDPVTNPGLKPEQGWTTELAALWTLPGGHQLRTSLLHEDTRDALYSQSQVIDGKTLTSVQNIGRIATTGAELALQAVDLFAPGFDLQGSLTYADSLIRENAGFVSTPGDTLGKQQPRVPKWRATLLASYAITAKLSASYGLRYAGRQYGTLNNSDANGFAYQGFSKFFTTDVRVRYVIDRQWSVAAGIDNLNNYRYWNFHPYTQRSYSAELRFDL